MDVLYSVFYSFHKLSSLQNVRDYINLHFFSPHARVVNQLTLCVALDQYIGPT